MDWREILMLRVLRILTTLHFTDILRLGNAAYKFTDYFKGIEKVEAVRRIFGSETMKVLNALKVEFTWIGGYMWVDSRDGRLMISSNYLNNGSRIDIYLDLIHELVHVKQFKQGKELFDIHYSYTERPTEIEAYRAAVEEARRLGLSDRRICQYLKTEWMTEKELKRLAKALDVRCEN